MLSTLKKGMKYCWEASIDSNRMLWLLSFRMPFAFLFRNVQESFYSYFSSRPSFSRNFPISPTRLFTYWQSRISLGISWRHSRHSQRSLLKGRLSGSE